MTRDSRLWWLVIACSVVTAISSRMDLIEALLPAQHSDKAHALIELLALLAGIVAGVMKSSPLPISDEGRQQYADAARLKR
jgi:hypothetical protein